MRSLLAGFEGCDIVAMQRGDSSPFPGEWDIEAVFSGCNRYGASQFAEQLRRTYQNRNVALLRSQRDGSLTIIEEDA